MESGIKSSAAGLAALLFFACHEAPRKNPFDPVLTPAVELSAALDDTAGTVALSWTLYQGRAAFARYLVLRRVAERTRVDTLAVIAQVDSTSFVDRTLEPGTAYVYRVSVVNQAGFEVASAERSMAGYTIGAVRLFPIESDGRSGVLRLRWGRYRDAGFAQYRVVRRVVGTDQEEVLAQVRSVVDTVYGDGSALAGVDYVYAVEVQAAGQELLSNTQGARLTLPSVEITRADFNSATASASLTWTQYQGPRFKAYRVLRRTGELTSQVIEETAEMADTSLVDPGLLGNTEYFYQVAVVTERQEEVLSEEESGLFHPRVGVWPLEVGSEDYVRLYVEGERLAALVTAFKRVRLLFFDLQGALLEETELVGNPDFSVAFGLGTAQGVTFVPRSAAMALSPEGQRYLSYGVVDVTPKKARVVLGELRPFRTVWNLFPDEFPRWTTLAIVERGSEKALVFTLDDRGYGIMPDGRELPRIVPFEYPVSELRIWEIRGRKWIGLCLPQGNQVLFGLLIVIQQEGGDLWSWGMGSRALLGAGTGSRANELVLPLSLDAGPDGRIFVLEAGNGRI